MAPNLLQMIFAFVFGDASSIKSVLTRGVSVLIVLITYFAISYQSEIANYLKEAPVQQYIETVIQKRQQQYPILAKERAVMLQNTINPSSVIIIGYSPQFRNEIANVITQVGSPVVSWSNIVIDKTSDMYKSNSLGEGYAHKVEPESLLLDRNFIFGYPFTRDFKYIFVFPIFDLDNSYSGAILICWVETPNDALKNESAFIRRMRLIVLPSARALGRAK